MARITKISLTLCALLFALPCTPLAQASEHTRPASAQKSHGPKKSAPSAKTTAKQKAQTRGATDKKSAKLHAGKQNGSKKTGRNSPGPASKKTAAAVEQCALRKGHKKPCLKGKTGKELTIAQAHKARVQKAQKTALNKLMGQIGKPYRWGGSSPRTGFDCSGLVYYAYKDLVKFPIPRTANEMYHLRDAAAVARSELERGDLVFFRTRGRGTADHVGVYLGNGKFIQSPRSGRDIQITSLSENYWQRHYVGARRVMTPKTVR